MPKRLRGFESILLIYRIILLRTLDPPERDAFLANKATKKGVKSNQVLAEIACTRSSKDLLLAKKACHIRYQKSMEEDVASTTTQDFLKQIRTSGKGNVMRCCLWWLSQAETGITKTSAALVSGIEASENMPRCINNCYNLESFWKNWHASFNKWLVRYRFRRALTIPPVTLGFAHSLTVISTLIDVQSPK
ncbi:hypothetical protein L1887_20822 [Cichorium endivia]|nr:hypothetical protein L1887_20822 [Cichorium endivia]